jgi:prepilin-type processing-associated H-X9-DG protein
LSFWWWGGWNPTNTTSWNVFGGLWPYHRDRAIVLFTDTHVKAMTVAQTTVGCDVRNGWTGRADRDTYLWDLN